MRGNGYSKRLTRRASRKAFNQSMPDYVESILADNEQDRLESVEETLSNQQFAIELEESLDRVISQYEQEYWQWVIFVESEGL